MAIQEVLEQHEHAAHAAHIADPFAKRAALLVAVLAACTALTEVGAKRVEIRAQESMVSAADAWAQYQAKSIRSAETRNIADLVQSLDDAADPAQLVRKQALVARLLADQARYDSDAHDGKDAIGRRAHALEKDRDEALHRLHLSEDGSAALQLAIVLATASAITASRLLIRLALGIGVIGILAALLAVLRPDFVPF